MTLKKEPLENIVEKGENADNQYFLLFQYVFQLFPKQISIFQSHLFYVVWKSFQFGPV